MTNQTLEQIIDSMLYSYHHCPHCDRDIEAIDEDEAAQVADAVKEYIKEKISTWVKTKCHPWHGTRGDDGTIFIKGWLLPIDKLEELLKEVE